MQMKKIKVFRNRIVWLLVALVWCSVEVKAQDKVEAGSVWIW